MSSVLVTGANRGIGLGIVRQLISHSSVNIVFATARDVKSAEELSAIESPKLHIIQLDVMSEESIDNAVKKVSDIVGVSGLDLLINNAGVGYTVPLNSDLLQAKLIEQFHVNSIAPLFLANKFYPLLKKAASIKGSAQIANISSKLGSLEITETAMGGMPYSIYAMSKSALNMLTRRLAIEWREHKIRATSLTPGWVQTRMGGDCAPLTVEEATAPLTNTILSLAEHDNGQCYTNSGEKIPW